MRQPKSSSFLKKRTKKLFRLAAHAASPRRPTEKSFCFFFQKEALSCFLSVSLIAGWYNQESFRGVG